MNSKKLEELSIERNLCISGISKDAVKKVRLFVVVRGEDNIVDDSLKHLRSVSTTQDKGTQILLSVTSQDPPLLPLCLELVGNACKHPDICRHALPK